MRPSFLLFIPVVAALSLDAEADPKAALHPVRLVSWKTHDNAVKLDDGTVTLNDARSLAEHPVDVAPVGERRYLCTGEIRSDTAETLVVMKAAYRTFRGQTREIRVFEYIKTLPEWTQYAEDVVFPENADRLVRIRLQRGQTEGTVSFRNMQLTEEHLRFDHYPRPFAVSGKHTGPTRSPTRGTAELVYPHAEAALSAEVFLPLIFGARSGLPARTVATLVFDLPKEVGRPYVITCGHPAPPSGEPSKSGQTSLGGVSYDRYVMPTLLSSAEYDGQAFLFLKPSLPVGRATRIGYFLEWQGGRQEERWLDIDMISIPGGHTLKDILVAIHPAPFYWEIKDAPGFAGLLHRVGIGGVEMSDIVGFDQRRAPTFEYFRKQGFQVLGMFSPGSWHVYERRLAEDEDMQAKGSDGKPVPTDHGPAACPSYRGPYYQKQMDLLRDYVRYDLDRFTFDEEFFGPGGTICFCNRCQKLFARYLQEHHPDLSKVAMEEVARNPRGFPVAAKAWAQFKADLMTEWYRDYRAAVEDAWSKRDPKRRVSFYATCQTLAHGAGEVEFGSIMRDNATRLGTGILQGLLPMPYFYDSYYGGSLRRVGEDLMQLQRMWESSTKGAPSLFPYLLSGGGGMCYVEPARGIKYQMYEAFTTGAVSGGILWNMLGMNGYHWKHLAEALHTLARFEEVLWGGTVELVACEPPEARVRSVRKGNRAVILVTNYGYDPVEVTVNYKTGTACIIENAETGRFVAAHPGGAEAFRVTLRKERACLLSVRPVSSGEVKQ